MGRRLRLEATLKRRLWREWTGGGAWNRSAFLLWRPQITELAEAPFAG
jgi:hypothetical protein